MYGVQWGAHRKEWSVLGRRKDRNVFARDGLELNDVEEFEEEVYIIFDFRVYFEGKLKA